jgi:hypothetical protein
MHFSRDAPARSSERGLIAFCNAGPSPRDARQARRFCRASCPSDIPRTLHKPEPGKFCSHEATTARGTSVEEQTPCALATVRVLPDSVKLDARQSSRLRGRHFLGTGPNFVWCTSGIVQWQKSLMDISARRATLMI